MDEKEATPKKASMFGGLISARYLLATLGSLGLGIVYGLKVNLHVTIVSMVNSSSVGHESSSNESCPGSETNSTISATENGPFDWSGTVQGTLVSAYFWGYMVAQVPGGRIAELFSAKWVMFFAVAANVFGTLITPVMANIHYGALIAVRVLEGVGGGVTFPAMHVMLAHWAPPSERSVMSSIVYAGTALGTVVSMLVSGIIAGAWGWEAVFYIQGMLCALWLIFWIWLVQDSPSKQRYITEEEKNYITSSLAAESVNDGDKGQRLPWIKVLTSPAFLAILIAHTCSNWGWYMVLTELPLYMKTVLNFKISENAVVTAVPFLCMWFFSMMLSRVIDILRGKNIINTTFARKLSTLIASVVPLICFIILCYIGCNRIAAVVIMTIAVMSIGGMFCGFLSNHIDIAPNYAGTLMALTNTVATIPGIVVPIFVGKITQEDKSIHSWRIIFWTTVGFYIIEILAYGIFGSGEVQPWNNPENSEAIEAQPLKSPVTPTKEKNYDSTTTN